MISKRKELPTLCGCVCYKYRFMQTCSWLLSLWETRLKIASICLRAITLTIVHPWERCLASTRLSTNVFMSLPLPFWWQEPCCSNECSLYPGSQIPPHIRCHPAARAEWCARREVSSNPPCPPSLPPPSRCQLSGPAVWVRGYRDYRRCRSTRRAFPSQGAQNACESDNR